MKKIWAFALLCSLTTTAMTQEQAKSSEPELRKLALDAYTYFYPLVLLDTTRRQATNVETTDVFGFAPANTFQHQRCLSTSTTKEVAFPNLDALYSSAWIDVSREPVILQWAETASRLYQVTLVNLWGETFASLGSRILGHQSAKIAITPPGWNGKLPKDVDRLESPSPYFRIASLILVQGAEDCPAANTIQDSFRATSLSDWIKEPKAQKARKFRADPRVDMTTTPSDQVKALTPAQFFRAAADLLRLQRPNPTDGTMLLQLRKLGLDSSKRFEFEKLAIPVQSALNEAPNESLQRLRWHLSTPTRWGNGWTLASDIVATYGNQYAQRAVTIERSLGSAPVEDMLTATLKADADGQPLNGELNYILRFKKEELPPATHWTITLYDLSGRTQSNEVKHFRIDSTSPLKADNQGNIELYFQAYTPGDTLGGNWFPTPRTPFILMMRLYEPQPSILEKRWTPPALEQVKNRL